jgi:hypothetical protein
MSDVRCQMSDVRCLMSDVGLYKGAVKTWVTLLGQNIGNTFMVIIYMFGRDLQFYSGRRLPE